MLHHKTGCRSHNTGCDGDCDCRSFVELNDALDRKARRLLGHFSIADHALRRRRIKACLAITSRSVFLQITARF